VIIEVWLSGSEPTIIDDLSSKDDDRINERDKQLLDCPDNAPDAIMQIMFSERHISVNWTIMGRSSLCYLMNGLNLLTKIIIIIIMKLPGSRKYPSYVHAECCRVGILCPRLGAE